MLAVVQSCYKLTFVTTLKLCTKGIHISHLLYGRLGACTVLAPPLLLMSVIDGSPPHKTQRYGYCSVVPTINCIFSLEYPIVVLLKYLVYYSCMTVLPMLIQGMQWTSGCKIFTVGG